VWGEKRAKCNTDVPSFKHVNADAMLLFASFKKEVSKKEVPSCICVTCLNEGTSHAMQMLLDSASHIENSTVLTSHSDVASFYLSHSEFIASPFSLLTRHIHFSLLTSHSNVASF